MKQKFLDVAKKLSKFSDHQQHHLACVIVNKNRIITSACNQMKTHPASIHPWKFLHAEIASLIGIDLEKTKGCTAYIYRENKQGTMSMAKPCPACMEALKLAEIKTIIYTVHGGWVEEKI